MLLQRLPNKERVSFKKKNIYIFSVMTICGQQEAPNPQGPYANVRFEW